MYDLNVDDFCRDASVIFLNLFQQFPKPITLYVEDICGPDSPDEFGLHSPRHMACFSAIVWLKEEGYIRCGQSVRQEAFEEVVLSQASFLYFTSIDEYGSEKSCTRIKRLHETLHANSSDSLKSLLLLQLKQIKA
jgi:hypothetical protein